MMSRGDFAIMLALLFACRSEPGDPHKANDTDTVDTDVADDTDVPDDTDASTDLPVDSAVPTDTHVWVEPPPHYKQLVSFGTGACGLQPDGSILCWGDAPQVRQECEPYFSGGIPSGYYRTIHSEGSCSNPGLYSVTDSGESIQYILDDSGYRYHDDLSDLYPKNWVMTSGTDWELCGITIRGRLYCTQNGRVPRWTPPAPHEYRFRTVSVSDWAACGITLEDRLVCWGAPPAWEGLPERGDGTFQAVDCLHTTCCAVTMAGAIECKEGIGMQWDRGTDELTYEGGTGAFAMFPPPHDDYVDVETAGAILCGLRSTGEITCWGLVLQGYPDDIWHSERHDFLSLNLTTTLGPTMCGWTPDGYDCYGEDLWSLVSKAPARQLP
jgi:hypothetical protein